LEISKGDNMKLSRLKEIVKEELGDKGLLHFESTYAYIWNFDKTYDERLRILKINPYEIIHTIEPTKEMQLIAVESRPNLIGKINKPAEEIQKMALNKDLFELLINKDIENDLEEKE